MTEAQYLYPAAEENQGISQTCSLGSEAPAMKILAYEDVPTTEGALMKVCKGMHHDGNPVQSCFTLVTLIKASF